MKSEHLRIRVEQCLLLASASHCPRRKLAAMLIDPRRNVVLADAYNGGPRGAKGGSLCKGYWCARDGIRSDDLSVVEGVVYHKGHPLPEGTDPDFMVAQYPPVMSGTRMEIGCHHAEMNVICNAAAQGVSTQGAWLIVPAEPCMMCAKAIHHAGIAKVVIVEDGYMGGKEGVLYLQEQCVGVDYVKGPKDPRLSPN